jgi:hypothetical protein
VSRPPYTPSEAQRLAICIGGAVLPRAGRRTAGATAGSVRHRYFERVNAVGREAALAEVEEPWRSVLEAVNLDGLGLADGSLASEVAFAWDWERDTARELGRGTDRDYAEVGDTEIPGTVDAVGLVGEDAVYVGDYKSEFLHVPPPRGNLQLRLYALMAARAYGRSRAVVEIVRPRRDEPAWRDRAELDAFDLVMVADNARDLAERVMAARVAFENGVEPRLVTGEHCRYCPSVTHCPEQTTLIRRLASEDGAALEERFFDALTPETAARAWHRVQAAKLLIERLEVALETYALHNPIDLGDGRVYGSTTQNSLSLNGAALEERFFDALTPETAARAWHRVQAAKLLIERLEVALETYALHNPIDLGDGRVYGSTTQNSLSLNGAAVWRFIAEQFGEGVAWDAVEIKAVQKRVKETLGPIVAAAGKDAALEAKLWTLLAEGGRKAKRITTTALFEALVELLARTGGARRSQIELVKIHRKGKGESDAA